MLGGGHLPCGKSERRGVASKGGIDREHKKGREDAHDILKGTHNVMKLCMGTKIFVKIFRIMRPKVYFR